MGSDRDLSIGARCKYLAMDATFDICSPDFGQLLTIQGFLPVKTDDVLKPREEWVVIACALMKQKTTKSYEIVLNAVVDAWKRLELVPGYKNVFMDFEQAELKAAMALLGANKVKGCMFHYCQAVLHCIKDLGKGMINRYKEDELFRLLIRAVLALPLLPPDLVELIWDVLKSELLALEEDKILIRCFVSYFGIQWLSKPLHVWNFYREDTRTNNAAEAYHSFLKKLRHGALRRPGNSLLFAFLQNLQFQQSVRVVRIESGASVKKKNRKYEKINDQLWESWKEFDIKARDRKSVDITTHCKEFLTIASHLVSDVNKTGLRTKKAERAAKNRKKRATDPVPVKEKKPKKRAGKAQPPLTLQVLDLTEFWPTDSAFD